MAPRARFELATLRLTAVNLISSQVAGVELNRGKSASSDQIGLVRFSFSFLLLFAFCNFSRRSYDTYRTPAQAAQNQQPPPISTDDSFSPSRECLVHYNSNQPAAKGAFMLKVWKVLRGSDSRTFDSLFRAFTALKNSTRYEVQQTITAREPSIELCRAFVQKYPHCSRFV